MKREALRISGMLKEHFGIAKGKAQRFAVQATP